MEHIQDLKVAMNRLIGQKVLKVAAGENTGSIINLEFGGELKTIKVGKNEFKEGDYSLMVNCSWRLGCGLSIITSWHEPNNIGGPMIAGLEFIVERRIVNVAISNYYDINIQMENEIELSIFSDLSKNQIIDTNWHFRYGSNGFVLNSQYKITHYNK